MGRPGLGGGAAAHIDFNVSHSGSLAAIACARGRRVGVDVERRRADRDLRALVPDVMGPREREMLQRLDDVEFVRAFYACWTRKEAIVKAMGAGIGYPLAGIDVPLLPPGGVIGLPSRERPGEEDVWSVRTLERADGYTLSVALEGSGGAISLAGHIHKEVRDQSGRPDTNLKYQHTSDLKSPSKQD